MINKYTHKNLTWIDLESPTREEVNSLMKDYAIDPLIAQDMLTPNMKPKIELHEKFLYVILNFPVLKNSRNKKQTIQELDFLISKDAIITTHYNTIDPLHKFSRLFEVDTILDKETMGDNAGYVFYYMMKRLYEALSAEIEYIDEKLVEIEADIFAEKEREMVFALSTTSRVILDFRQAILHHKETLTALEKVSSQFFGDKFVPYIQSLSEQYIKISDHLRVQGELIHELRSTNDSLLNTKQTETMKVFTVMAFITLPLSLLVEILAFPSPYNPIPSLRYDFWIIIGTVIVGIIFMLSYFKYKKWI